MLENLTVAVLVLQCLVIVLLILLLRTSRNPVIESQFQQLAGSQDKMERSLREEIARNREETAVNFRLEREELSRSFQALNVSHLRQMGEMAAMQNRQLEIFGNQLSQLALTNEQKLENMR
ncbi:MAG: DNA recombination protein RmuC, partial [Bacillota bacterium]